MTPLKKSLPENTIFNYNNHLKFLKECYEVFKKNKTNFSHRFIAIKMRLKSSAIFLHIINRKIKLSDCNIERFCDLFKLGPKEAKYFKLLVNINQSHLALEKIFYLHKMIMFIKSNLDSFSNVQFNLFIEWYYLPFFLLSSHEYYDLTKKETLLYVIDVLSSSHFIKKLPKLKGAINQVLFEKKL